MRRRSLQSGEQAAFGLVGESAAHRQKAGVIDQFEHQARCGRKTEREVRCAAGEKLVGNDRHSRCRSKMDRRAGGEGLVDAAGGSLRILHHEAVMIRRERIAGKRRCDCCDGAACGEILRRRDVAVGGREPVLEPITRSKAAWHHTAILRRPGGDHRRGRIAKRLGHGDVVHRQGVRAGAEIRAGLIQQLHDDRLRWLGELVLHDGDGDRLARLAAGEVQHALGE